MNPLSSLGFGPFFERQLSDSDSFPARITAEHRGRYEVRSAVGDGSARLAGRLTQDLEGEALPGVGDWVTLDVPPEPGQTSVISGILARRTVFLRGAAGRSARAQVIAANVDVVFVVCGLDNDYNVHRIERYLARIWASGAQPVVILNKADVCDEVDARVSEVQRACLGVPVLLVSALLSEGLEGVRAHLGDGLTAAFVGSSGAGKSTLLNALLGEERMATNDTRASDGQGQHTTTHRQLILFPQHGCLIDTPGMRELQLLDEDGLSEVFSDVEDLASGCRFTDCSHQTEPGCAVREAVEAGALRRDRVEHFSKLKTEAHAYEVRHDVRRRRQAERDLQKLYRTGKHARRFKEGG